MRRSHGFLPRAAAALALCALGVTATLATGNLEQVSSNAIVNRVWPNNLIPVAWRYHDPTTLPACAYSSTNAAPATLQPAVAAGFTPWQSNPDSRISFTYGGTTSIQSVGADGVNVITFCDSEVLGSELGFLASTPSTSLTAQMTVTAGGGCPAGRGLLDLNGNPPPGGFCFPVGTYPAGTLVDADIRFNTRSTDEDRDFTTTGTAGFFDVQAISTHEEGHFHGLSHDPIQQTVMFPFIDDEPPSDGLGQRVPKHGDLSTSSRYYPEASFGSSYGSITGFISLNGVDADGVHVVAIDPTTMLGVEGRFSVSRFQSGASTLGPEGPDFAVNGAGFYRIDGLPAGNYYVYVEYFDDTDFISQRLQNRYNTTVLNSNVSNGNPGSMDQVGGWLGFIPQLTEFYNTGDSGDGGADGINPGAALDNSDRATLVPMVAGSATTGINIAINIEVNGQTGPNRQNPTNRTTLVNDALQGTDILTAFVLNGGTDDFYAVRFPSNLLPAPPYNVAEGLWIRGGKSTSNYVTRLVYGDPNNSARPALNDPVVASSGRVLSGGPNGLTTGSDFLDVRDQWNVTINDSRDVWIVANQPASPPGTTFITSGFFCFVARTAAGGNRVGRTLVTQNGGGTWGTLTADLLYDLILEADPPVMITSASPSSLEEGSTGVDVNVNGFGFKTGATVDFGPGIMVNSVTFISAQQLRCNLTIPFSGATSPRGANVKVTDPEVVFPNVSRVFTVLPAADGDSDGVPNALDCAPADATLKHAATEAQNLDAIDLGGSTSISWDSQDALNGTGTVYDVVTGLIGDLRMTATYAAAVCAVNNDADTPFVDLNPAPAGGAVRYWLVRAANGCNVGPGTYGNSSVMPDPRDALDAGAPCP